MLHHPRIFPHVAAFLDRGLPRTPKLCFTNGCFDLLHPGHVRYLEDCRALGDFLVVGLNTDASVVRIKGPRRPIQDQMARAAILAGLRAVDAVVLFDEDTPLELIQSLTPDILAKGGDYSRETVVGAEWVEAHGGKVVLIPFLEGHSSTKLIQRIKEDRGVTMDSDSFSSR